MIAIRSHSRSAWAMTWVEKMIVTPFSARLADQPLELALVDRVEAGEGLVEDDQARLVDERAEQLDGLRHALGQGADRLLGPFAEAVLLEQFVGAAPRRRQRQAAERAHEGDALARVHRRVEPALLRQIADLVGGLDRAVMAEHAALARRRLDDPEQHSERGRLARAVGAEQAEDRAGRDVQADAVDGALLGEVLDQVPRLDRAIRWSSFAARPVEALLFLTECLGMGDMGAPVDKSQTLKEAIRAEAERLGFAACGFARADAADAAGLDVRRWLEAGHHGTMGWMEARADHRVSPTGAVARTRSPRSRWG